MKLKEKNEKLKILIAIGGWNAGSYPFEQVTNSTETLNQFAQSSVEFLRQWNFDGLGKFIMQGHMSNTDNFLFLLKMLIGNILPSRKSNSVNF